ncbi:DUF4344 domain-containing metallopeptidase [Parvularcula lutaonensis]|uniref:DUF4344 domain-containing metallopeptidase n=1 Tax=Parvularcula lutaonensis TaxID=491923 RepID=A0ABV7MEM9_9PROT|nr:DUF4344 domain-containing metallopeptidase [Parvularcula lutaonensis]GGY57194.1 hypothetical protein GCM10007148_28330 [Parvularcula lutaonensis]
MFRVVSSLLALGLSVSSWATAKVTVAERQRVPVLEETIVVQAGSTAPRSLNLSRGDIVYAGIRLSPHSTPDLSAFICPRPQYDAYLNGTQPQGCNGFWKQESGGTFQFEAPYSGEYVFFIDNTFSMFSEKHTAFNLWLEAKVPDEMRRGLEGAFQEGYDMLAEGLEFPPFDITIEPCGQINAFSNTATGDITLCGELFFEAVKDQNQGALTGIFLHELGHTLLNLWGLPNYQNEQTVDEFAAVMMVMGDMEEMAEQYIAFFAGSNTMAEAQAAESGHSPHPLSVQRMRNVAHIIDQPDEYIARWRPLIWHAPIGWSGLIVSALSASGPLERRSPVRVADIPERYAA